MLAARQMCRGEAARIQHSLVCAKGPRRPVQENTKKPENMIGARAAKLQGKQDGDPGSMSWENI